MWIALKVEISVRVNNESEFDGWYNSSMSKTKIKFWQNQNILGILMISVILLEVSMDQGYHILYSDGSYPWLPDVTTEYMLGRGG